VGVANDVDATRQALTTAPVADTYYVFRIEVDSAGKATFYIDGTQVGTQMSGAVTASVALTPVFIIYPQGAVAGRTMTIDYVHCAQTRG
jgi:hypothetical protein